MYTKIQKEIPEFLSDQMVYCVNIMPENNLKSTLVLTKQATLYEFRNKILLNQIDLLKSCLVKEQARLKQYTGFRCQCFKMDENENTNKFQNTVINFNKYIFMNKYSNKHYYILLQCWQQLVIIERLCENKGFRIAAEYADIIDYDFISGSILYQPELHINLQNGLIVKTSFQQSQQMLAETIPERNDFKLKEQFAKPCNENQRLKTQLHLTRQLNKCELMRVRNQHVFGIDLVRNSEIQEKHQLTRCGDVWLRLSNNQKIIIGVPFVNNCTPPNISILKHIKGIFINSNVAEETRFNYINRLYQLNMRIENLEFLESFFQCYNSSAHEASNWQECQNNQMAPEIYYVLLIVIDIVEISSLDECLLYISYDIEKNLELHAASKPKMAIFKQQLFIKKFNISEILAQHSELRVKLNDITLHQDLLAVMSSSHELQLNLNFNNIDDAEKFESMLAHKFECEVINRASKSDASSIIRMELDDTQVGIEVHHSVWYTAQSNSIWHGLLVIRVAQEPQNKLQWLWKFYTRDESHTILLLRMLLNDFLCNDINMKDIDFQQDCDNKGMIADTVTVPSLFFEAIKVELNYVNFIFSVEDIGYKQHLLHINELNKLQLKTDQAMTTLNKEMQKTRCQIN